jgi:hypothetical protein
MADMSFEDYRNKFKPSPSAALPSRYAVADLGSSADFSDLYKFMGEMTNQMAGIGEKRRQQKQANLDRTFEQRDKEIAVHEKEADTRATRDKELRRQFNVANPPSLTKALTNPIDLKLAEDAFAKEEAPKQDIAAMNPLIDQLRKGITATGASRAATAPPDWSWSGIGERIWQVANPWSMPGYTAAKKEGAFKKLNLPAGSEDPLKMITAAGDLNTISERMRKRRRVEALQSVAQPPAEINY